MLLVVGAVAGGAGGVVGVGGGLTAPGEAGGEGAGTCFAGAGLGFASGFGFAVTAATGVTEAGAGAATREGAPRWCGAFGIGGAWTTLRPGLGPRAMPNGRGAAERRRGRNAAPAIAITRRNAAIARSLPLMLFHSPAENIPRRLSAEGGSHLMLVRLQLSSFKLKLVAYFVLLSLIPMAATYWGFSTVAGAGESRQVALRQEAGLRAALAVYQERAERARAEAQRLARLRPLQRALERDDARAVGRILDGNGSLYALGAGRRAGTSPRLAARLPVEVVTGTRRVGEVVATVPLDMRLVRSLRRGVAFDAGDVLVLLDGTRIVASAPSLRGHIAIAAGRSATIELAGTRYRALAAPALPEVPAARLAVLTPKALLDAADTRTRERLLVGLLACLALVGVVAYLQGRSIVRNLRRFATAARGIAHGSLRERVPVRGRDEFAALGAALNDMAAQLEARLAELEAERARGREALARFGEALAATHDSKQLLRIVAAEAAEATSARGCRIVAADGFVVTSGDVDADGERLTIPLNAGGKDFGTLELVGHAFSDDERLNAASLAAQAVVALENARLHGLVERQALIDGLTGLANRRASSDALRAETARAARLETPLSVVLADLDEFKDVNDDYGHAVGDEVLRAFADVLRETLRESDVAGRWGGEEFLLLLPGADEDGAAQLAERIRAGLAERRIPGARGLRVTASFGVAEYTPESSSEQLVAAADGALYRAKRAGKDRVERAASARF